jgi:hypothetical protein
MQVAHHAEISWRRGGVEGARELVGNRAGHGLDPDIAALLCDHAETVLDRLDAPSLWDELLAAEPGRCPLIANDDRFEGCLTVIADFADMKTTKTAGHSRAVASLAENAAAAAGMAEAEVARVRHAALVHDVGRVAISARIWTKAGELSRDDQEKVRLAPYYTERILNRPERLRELGHIAGMHQERHDGSGYHRGLHGAQIPAPARILAVADAYQTLTEARPGRKALPPEAGSRSDHRRSTGWPARPRRRQRSPRSRRPTRGSPLPGAPGRPHRPRDPGPQTASARPRDQANRLGTRDLAQDRGPPHPIPVRQDRHLDPRRRHTVRTPAEPPAQQ